MCSFCDPTGSNECFHMQHMFLHIVFDYIDLQQFDKFMLHAFWSLATFNRCCFLLRGLFHDLMCAAMASQRSQNVTESRNAKMTSQVHNGEMVLLEDWCPIGIAQLGSIRLLVSGSSPNLQPLSSKPPSPAHTAVLVHSTGTVDQLCTDDKQS